MILCRNPFPEVCFMSQKSSKTSTPRVAAALVLVPALVAAVLWFGMGQVSLSNVQIQDEAASVQVQATVAQDSGVAPALKSWEYTLRTTGSLTRYDPNDLNGRSARTPNSP